MGNTQAYLPPLYLHLPFYWMQLSSYIGTHHTPLLIRALSLKTFFSYLRCKYAFICISIYSSHQALLDHKKNCLKRGILNHHILSGICLHSEIDYTGVVEGMEFNWQQLLKCVQSEGSGVRPSVIAWTFHSHTYIHRYIVNIFNREL